MFDTYLSLSGVVMGAEVIVTLAKSSEERQ